MNDDNTEGEKLVRDTSFLFKNNKNVIILLFQYHFYISNNFSLKIYHDKIINYHFPCEVYNVTNKIIENYDEITKIISENMHSWEFYRLGNIEKALLCFGCYYIVYCSKISHSVVIYFCIKQAQLYCDSKAYRLVNKILDCIVKEHNS